MDLVAFKGAIDGVGYIRSALGLLLKEKIEMAVRERVLEVLSRIDSIQADLFDARENSHKLQMERDELERKIREFEDWKETENKYRLLITPGGARVFQSTEDPMRFACPACFAQRSVVPLQESMPGVFNCPNAKCKAQYIVAAVERPVTISDFDPRRPFGR